MEEKSVLQILCKEQTYDFCENINYVNAEVEKDEDSGLYVAIIQDELSGVDDAAEALYGFIEDEIQDYCEIVSQEDLVESVPCSECGEECICTNGNFLEVGTCVNCGHVNRQLFIKVTLNAICPLRGSTFSPQEIPLVRACFCHFS